MAKWRVEKPYSASSIIFTNIEFNIIIYFILSKNNATLADFLASLIQASNPKRGRHSK